MRHGPRHCRPGSSPLTRGKLDNLTIGEVITRLIPAHAGKTATIRRPTTSLTGSSPLTRGKRQRWNGPRGGIGLIPAHAGKTAPLRRVYCETEAHPRSRGENGQRSAAYFAAQGSSPLTRGKPDWRRRRSLGAGLIPAHAGKTLVGEGDERVHWAHPRSRGENRRVG